MRRIGVWLLAGLGLFVMGTGPAAAAPLVSSCQVSKIVDGDTLHLTCDGVRHKVRLMGYDTPEIFHPKCAAEKTAGQKATERLRRLVNSAPVTGVTFKGLDRYGRDLGWVQIGGRDVSDYMLASPLARPYQGRKHPDWCGILGS